jgi:uncharacterized membrane protein YkoI
VLLVLTVAGCGDDDKADKTVPPPAAPAPATPSVTIPSLTGPTPSAVDSASPGGQMTEDQAQRSALVPLAKIDYTRAAEAASTKVPDAKVFSVELTRAADNTAIWDVRVAGADGTEHRVDVDAAAGTVRNDQVDADQDAEDKRKLADRLGKATTTWQQATDTALARKQGTVTSVDLDENDADKLIWSVDIVTTNDWNKTTYDVDATTGQVIREHVDRD